MTSDLTTAVANAIDRAALGASAPALLLEAQAHLGLLAARASQLTNRGVRPFRPDAAWTEALGQLAFTIYNLADQTGVDVEEAVRRTAHAYSASVPGQPAEWPIPG